MSNESAKPSRSRKFWLAGGLLAIGVLSAGAVSAQWGAPRGDHWGASPRGEGMRAERMARFQQFCRNDTARYQPVARLFVKADLKLNKEQEAAFDALADTLFPSLEGVKSEACNNFVERAGTAPEKLRRMAAVLRKAADAAEKAVEPANQFYAKLDDDQKARVEELTERRRGMGGPGTMMPR
jgi:LTXXQ motif family protein